MLRQSILTVVLGIVFLSVGTVAPSLQQERQTVPAKAPPAGQARSLKDEIPPLVPKEPAEAAKTFRVLDGFRMDLIAHEPQVTSPVAAAYDEDGRLYVVEMRDYPDPLKPGETPLGRIRLLEDRDGDGFYETSHIFAEGLPWPTGIACWDGGVYVTAAPDIWYLKDTKGDGKADIRRKVYTGFVAYNVQALVNGLQWGVDNRICGVTAGNGGAIRPSDQPEAKPISVRGRDFRFDPATGRFEAISGTAQFGNAYDDWYNRFLSANRLVTGHVAIASQYLARNPYLPLARVVQDCAAEGVDVPLPMYQISPAEPWRVVRTRRYIEEKQKQPLSEMVVKGIFTSGTGIAIYRGAAYPEKYRGNAFVGNPAGNLVHRRLLTPQGATFVATRADREVEFVASTDNFFRPVNCLNAPDGTLHIIDMYREVVEHPWSLPDDIKAALDLSSGRDRGRIYRLTPPGFQRPAPPRLGKASTKELVATLENPNSWWRETAQRLLYQRQDKSAVPLLRQLARQSASPLTQLHALGTLDGLGALEMADVALALNSHVSGLREHGLRLAEPRLKGAPELAKKVLALGQDQDARVRFQAALTLGELSRDETAAALARIARRDAKDPWLRLAVLSSSGERADRLLDLLVQGKPEAFAATEPGLALLHALAAVIGARNRPPEIEHTLRVLADAAGGSRLVQRELVLGLDEGLLRAGKTLESLKLAAGEPAGRLLRELFTEAAKTAVDEQATVSVRTQAVQLLGRAEPLIAMPTLRLLLDPRQPQPIQLAVARSVRNSTFADVPGLLLERWSSYTPPVRAEVLAVLSARTAWTAALLDAMASRKILVADVDAPRRQLLLKHRDAQVRARAVELFGDLSKTPRAEIVTRYRPALELKRDTTRGRAVFQRECASCHMGGGIGQNVGPAIASIGTRTPETLLISILDPNREVDPRYLNYSLVTRDGRFLTGIIAAETDTAVVLRRTDGASDTILRTQIEELNSTGQSLMPEGFEQKINQQEMADLLAFLMETS
jgi:putative membrane-bound dehydrogenase-like protein